MHFSRFNAVVISSHLHRAELSQIFTGWQESQICLRAAAETLSSAAQRRTETLMSLDESCHNNHVSTEEITSAQRRYKRHDDVTAVFDAIFDYANAANKWGGGVNTGTKEQFNMSVLLL